MEIFTSPIVEKKRVLLVVLLESSPARGRRYWVEDDYLEHLKDKTLSIIGLDEKVNDKVIKIIINSPPIGEGKESFGSFRSCLFLSFGYTINIL